ncbi:hypothetical protein FVAG_03131, partial [Fusobacterium varium ATCC 27725]
MNSEEYIYRKLDTLSSLDKVLSEEMVKHLGEWATIDDVAKLILKNIGILYATSWKQEIYCI